MLQKNTIDFLKKLKKNNNREWFEVNRPLYEAAKADCLILVAAVLNHLGKLDARFLDLEAKQCLFRVNRDVRFSKDKSPYKTNFGAGFTVGGKKSPLAGFYLHIDPTESFAGGGLWMPDADKLKNVRQEIDYHVDEFKTIVGNKKFVETFKELNQDDKLKNPPKGYDKEHKLVEYLKLKSYVAGHGLVESDLYGKELLKKITSSFDRLNPFIQFLNRAIE